MATFLNNNASKRMRITYRLITASFILSGFTFIGSALAQSSIAIVPDDDHFEESGTICTCPEQSVCLATSTKCGVNEVAICCPAIPQCVKNGIGDPFPPNCF